ncbi:MAG: T9SS type A sorting domain-containing protein [bacterium]
MKKILLLLVVVSMPLFGADMFMPSFAAHQGDTVMVPLCSVIGAEIIDSAQGELFWTSGLQFVGFQWGPGVNPSMADTNLHFGSIEFVIAHSLSSVDSVLLKLFFRINAPPPNVDNIYSNNLRFNEDPIIPYRVGFISSNPMLKVQVGYYNGGGVPWVNVNLKKDSLFFDSKLTQPDGRTAFLVLPYHNYQLNFFKGDSSGPHQSVDAMDARLTMRYVVHKEFLTYNQLIAANVSGSDSVTGFDASMIFNNSLGSLLFFTAGEWKFLPDTVYRYVVVDDSVGAIGIRIGDVDGDWNPFTGKASSVDFTIIIRYDNNGADLYLKGTDLLGGNFSLDYGNVTVSRVTMEKNISLTVGNYQNNFGFFHIDQYSGEIKIGRINGSGDWNSIEVIYAKINGQLLEIIPVVEQATGIQQTDLLPLATTLVGNYPNPFNPVTTITYTIAKAGKTTIELYDVTGQKAAILVNEHKTPGTYSLKLDGKDLSSGVYFYRLKNGNVTQTKKMVLLK